MSLEKAELKKLILHELGCDFEDVKDGMQRDMYRQEGGASALRAASAAILALHKLVDDDVEKGRVEPDQAQRVKDYISRAAAQCDEMGKAALHKRMVCEGRMQGVDQIVGMTKKKHEHEQAKLDALEEAIREAEANGGEADLRRPGRIAGLYPGRSIAQQRRAEEEASKSEIEPAAKAAKAASEIMDEIKASARKTKKKTPRKKRTRKDNGTNP